MLEKKLFPIRMGVAVLALGLAFGCGRDTTEDEPLRNVAVTRQALGEKEILDALADSMPNQEINVPGATGREIEKALDDLGKRFKEADTEGKRIKAEDTFYNSLTAKQKRGADRIADEYKKKVDAGEVKAEKD